MMFNYKANGPFFDASATTTLHTTRVRTSVMVGTAVISNMCSDSPGGGPGTGGCSAVSFRSILGGSLTIVSDATTSLYGSGGLPVLMFDVRSPRGVCGTIYNRGVNAVMATGGWFRFFASFLAVVVARRTWVYERDWGGPTGM